MRDFHLEREVEVAATPEQVWDAIATGPGADSWFMGSNEIEPGVGGATSMTMLGHTQRSTVTAWHPPQRFAHQTPPGEDGSFMAFEYVIEGRDGGTSVLRMVQSGVLGDDWETEYEAMKAGWALYLETLAAYLVHFPGRIATPITAAVPDAGAAEGVWAALGDRFGLPAAVSIGGRASLRTAGLSVIDGVVDCVHLPHYLGIRTNEGFYRFVHSGPQRGEALIVGHHIFVPIERGEAETAWHAWLREVAST